MHSNIAITSLLATASLISTIIAKPIFSPKIFTSLAGPAEPQLAVYWGQGPGQKRLAEFCADTTLDIIPIAFVNIFPDETNGPGNNYGNACGSDLWVTPDNKQTQMLTQCSQIAEDIKTCQNAGKKILASIGGAAPGTNFLASKESAVAFADFLWGSFGPLQDPTLKQYPRPFGTDTIVDGFDLDIESGPDSFYSDLVNELRAKFAQSTGTYYISAAPQCVVPDAHLEDAIANSYIDYLFIQFYNTDSCSAASLFSSGSLNTNTDITFGWQQWLADNSQNKNIKIFLGLPASTSAAHSQDYLSISKAKSLIEEYACSDQYSSSFGGVMLWDATYSDQNTDPDLNGQSYAYNMKEIFGQLSCAQLPQAPASSTTTVTTITTTTTSSLTTTTTPPTTVAAPATSTSASTTTSTTTHQFVPETTSSSTTSASPAASSSSTWTTSTSSYSHVAIGGTTSSSSPTSTTSSHGVHVGVPSSSTSSSPSTTTTSATHHARDETTSSSSSTTTTTYSHPVAEATSTSSMSATTASSHGHGDSHSSPTSSAAVASTTSSYYWGDWTSSGSKPVDAATTSAVTTSSFDWADWEASKSSSTSKPVDPATTTSNFNWADWEASKTSTTTSDKPVKAASTSTSSSSDWADWEKTASTESYTAPTATAVMTQTLVPVKPTDGAAAVDQPSGLFSGYTGPSFIVSTAVKPAATSEAGPSGWSGKSQTDSLASVAAASATNSGWLASSSGSSTTPVAPATFTGGAAQQELPGTVLSVAACLAVAVVGLIL